MDVTFLNVSVVGRLRSWAFQRCRFFGDCSRCGPPRVEYAAGNDNCRPTVPHHVDATTSAAIGG